MVVHRGERPPAAGHRAQLHGVALDLGRRHEGDDLVLPVAGRAGAADPPAPRVEVAHHVALVALGHPDREQRDRLQHRRAGRGHRLLEALRGGRPERHLGGVDGVELAVVALDPHVDDGEAVDAAGGHRLLDAALHRRDVLLRDRAADDRVLELGAVAATLGLTRRLATAYWPWPPDCFLTLPSASAVPVIVSRYGTRTSSVSTFTPNLRASRSSATVTCVSPQPRSTVWPVSSLRSTRGPGPR